MIYTALIVDDEPPARKKIKRLLEAHDDIKLVGEAENGLECIKMVEKLSPTILFLDIQMPVMTGIDVLDHLPPESMPVIVFTTAYDQYAIKAFEVQAVDYLLKPFDQDRFNLAMTRVKERCAHSESESDKILALQKHLNPTPTYSNRFLVKDGESLVFLKTEEIDWLESEGNYVIFYSNDKEYMIRGTLNNIENKLDPEHFIRIHRSYIVKIDYIKEVYPVRVGEYTLILNNDKKLYLGKKYKQRLLDLKI